MVETLSVWNGVVSDPFTEDGAGLMQHLQTTNNRGSIYPNNSRVLASTKFSAYPIAGRRSLDITTLGTYAYNTAVLAPSQIYFFNPNLQTSSTLATGFSNPDHRLFFEFDGGVYYTTESPLIVRRKDLVSGTETTITTIPSTYENAYGTLMSNKNIGVIACNYSSGTVAYRLDFNIPSKPNANTTAIIGVRLSQNCVSIDEYKNYATMLCTKSNGSVVAFWDGESAKCSFIEDVPQGTPLFIRSVAGYLLVATLDYNVNDVSLVFSLYDGDKFKQVYTYTKYNPASKVVNIRDSSARVDDGVLYFTGDFCGESGLWLFDPNTLSLEMTSYVNNSELSPAFTTVNYCAQPTYWGITGADSDAFCYQNTNNDFNTVQPKYVTRRFDGGSKKLKKKWLSVGLSSHTDFDQNGSVPTTQSVLIEYRTDNNNAWTTLGTHVASDEPFTEFAFENTLITIEDYYTIQFRLTWSGLVYGDEFYVKHDVLPQIEI